MPVVSFLAIGTIRLPAARFGLTLEHDWEHDNLWPFRLIFCTFWKDRSLNYVGAILYLWSPQLGQLEIGCEHGAFQRFLPVSVYAREESGRLRDSIFGSCENFVYISFASWKTNFKQLFLFFVLGQTCKRFSILLVVSVKRDVLGKERPSRLFHSSPYCHYTWYQNCSASHMSVWLVTFFFFSIGSTCRSFQEAQWPIGYGVGLRIKRSSARNPAVAAALSPWTRLFTPIVPRRSLHILFY